MLQEFVQGRLRETMNQKSHRAVEQCNAAVVTPEGWWANPISMTESPVRSTRPCNQSVQISMAVLCGRGNHHDEVKVTGNVTQASISSIGNLLPLIFFYVSKKKNISRSECAANEFTTPSGFCSRDGQPVPGAFPNKFRTLFSDFTEALFGRAVSCDAFKETSPFYLCPSFSMKALLTFLRGLKVWNRLIYLREISRDSRHRRMTHDV